MYHRAGFIGICDGSDVIEKLIRFIQAWKPEAPGDNRLFT